MITRKGSNPTIITVYNRLILHSMVQIIVRHDDISLLCTYNMMSILLLKRSQPSSWALDRLPNRSNLVWPAILLFFLSAQGTNIVFCRASISHEWMQSRDVFTWMQIILQPSLSWIETPIFLARRSNAYPAHLYTLFKFYS